MLRGGRRSLLSGAWQRNKPISIRRYRASEVGVSSFIILIQRVLISNSMPAKPARSLTFKCKSCAKPVQVFLQKVSACSHIQPYQGICKCGEVLRHATGQKEAVESYIAVGSDDWTHHH